MSWLVFEESLLKADEPSQLCKRVLLVRLPALSDRG